MAQLITATFIKDTGFATWLTPTVQVVEALTGAVIGTFNMSEVAPWNYIYNFPTNTETVVYFFNIDAGTDDVINRYQWVNNKIDTIPFRTGWSSVTYNKVITDKEMSEIAKKVAENLPEQKEITLDTSKIEEKLGVIEDKIENNDIEFDYWTILSSNEKNKLEIIKKIEKIKIPKYDDKKVIEAINKIEIDAKWLELEEIKKQTKKIKTKKEEKEEDLAEKLSEKIEEQLEEELPEIMIECLKKEPEFISLVNIDE